MLTVRIIAPRCAVFCQDIVGKRHVSREVFEREMYVHIFWREKFWEAGARMGSETYEDQNYT